MSLAAPDWTAAAEALEPRAQAFVAGSFADAADGATFADHSPRDGRHLADVAACSAADVDRAVAAARRSFEGGVWSRAAPAERRRVLLRLADLMEERLDDLALLESLDVGKPIGDALRVDVPAAAACLRFYAEALDKVFGETAPVGPDAVALVEREPLGVVAAVVPWNYPLIITAWKLGPALADRQLGDPQAGRAVAALGAAARRARGRSRDPRRRAVGPSRLRARGRRAARAPSRRRQGRLHRVGRDRPALPCLRRRVKRQGGLARARRQEPARRARRRA